MPVSVYRIDVPAEVAICRSGDGPRSGAAELGEALYPVWLLAIAWTGDELALRREVRREFPGRLDAVAAAREFVYSTLDGCPAAADAALCASEAVTNAVMHTRSGEPGGTVQVHVTAAERAWVRLEVSDQGGPGSPTLQSGGTGDDHGRGLHVIAALTSCWRFNGDSGGRSVRMRLPWYGLGGDLLPQPRRQGVRQLMAAVAATTRRGRTAARTVLIAMDGVPSSQRVSLTQSGEAPC